MYFELGMGPGGLPVESFIKDPPIPLPEGLAIPARGVQLYPINGIYHIIDRVGVAHYPNVPDMVEEVRRMGLSRRLPRNLDFSKLTPASRIILLHNRAIITNHRDYNPRHRKCPKLQAVAEMPDNVRHLVSQADLHRHDPGHDDYDPEEMCAGLWWDDIEGGLPVEGGDARRVLRQMPSFQYSGRRTPLPAEIGMRPDWEPLYAPGFFAAFPCGRLVRVRDDARDAIDDDDPEFEAAGAGEGGPKRLTRKQVLTRMERAAGLTIEEVDA